MNYITMKHWNSMDTVWEWMVISWEHTMGLFEIQWDKMICWRVLPTYIGVDWDVKCDKQVGELFAVDISWSKGALNHHLVGYKLHSSKQQKWRRYGDLSNRFRVCSQQKQGIRWILVGGLEHFLFFHILGIIIPTDELIFFRGVGQPPTRINWILDYQTTIIGYWYY